MRTAVPAFVRAAMVYERETCAHTLTEDLEWYLLNGFVFSRPDLFIMGRPVMRNARQELITGWHRFPDAECDCWHVYLSAGNIVRAWDFMPWPLDWVSFERENVLRILPMSAIQRICTSVHHLSLHTKRISHEKQ